MRQKYIQTKSRQQANMECPWASHIVKVSGGYMCFESDADYCEWCNIYLTLLKAISHQ